MKSNKLKFTLLSAVSMVVMQTMVISAIAKDKDPVKDNGTVVDEIIVHGVRGAQEAAIQRKRNAAEIIDSIVAEDIGKLPDVTIADALQRITGVQISRRAGQGAAVSIRGSNNVLTTFNGERFISAESLLDPRADFQDIPASLVTGVNVYKSLNASITDGGVGGVIDLLTLRSLNLDKGMTVLGSAEAGLGSKIGGVDYRVEGLIGMNWGDKIAMSLTGSYGDSTSASSYQQTDADLVDEFSTWICPGGCGDLNGNGNTTDSFISPLGWNSFVNNREFKRQRLGLAYNLNADLGEAWEIIADVIYNKMNEVENGQQLFINGNFAPRNGPGDFLSATGQAPITGFNKASSLTNRDYYVTKIKGYRTGLRAGVNSALRNTKAINTNLELKYDDGGAFKGSVRWVYGYADRKHSSITLAQQTSTLCLPRSAADVASGSCTDVNPGSIPMKQPYVYGVSLGQKSLSYTLGNTISKLASNPAAWYLHSSWLESKFTNARQNIFRADGSYDLDDSYSVNFGVRYSKRNTDERRADYFSPSGLPGLLSKYEESGYAIHQTVGVASNYNYDPLPVFQLDGAKLSPLTTMVSNFGNVPGLKVNIPMIDTHLVAGNFEAFRDNLYGPGKYITAPDRSYSVGQKQLTAYLMANFNTDVSDNMVLSGNFGLRIVKTDLEVLQNIVQGGKLNQHILAGLDPNHSAYIDLGDKITSTSRTAYLPSVNINLTINKNNKLKFAYSETQAVQPFANLGRGEITFFNGERAGEVFQRVSSVQRLGNPNLDPTRQKSISVAWEWYPNDSTLISVGLFYNKIDSYTFQRSSQIAVADSDGVVRNGATLLEIANGKGGNYHGFELAYQQTFDFLPGILGNTGITLNYTYSPSQSGIDAKTGKKQILADGSFAPLNNTSKHQVNAILFYQDDKFQARVALNYLSPQYLGAFTHWSFNQKQGIGIGQYNKATLYLDISASYEINDNIQVYISGQNLTAEANVSYTGWSNNRTKWNQWERVINIGVKARY